MNKKMNEKTEQLSMLTNRVVQAAKEVGYSDGKQQRWI